MFSNRFMFIAEATLSDDSLVISKTSRDVEIVWTF